MNGLMLLMSLAAPGVEYGWQTTPQGLEYIVQIEPQVVQSMIEGRDVYSVVPENITNIDRIRLHQGEGQLSKDDVAGVNGLQDVEFGHQPLVEGGTDFIVQILPTGVRSFQAGTDVVIPIPAGVNDIRRFTVRIGNGSLPPGATPTPAAVLGAGDPPPAPPASVITMPPAPVVDPVSPYASLLTPGAGAAAPMIGAPPRPTPNYTLPNSVPNTGPNAVSNPYRTTETPYVPTSPPSYGYPPLQPTSVTPLAPTNPRAPATAPTRPLGTPPNSSQPVLDPNPTPRPTLRTASPSEIDYRPPAATVPKERPWLPMLFTSLALIASLGANLFLGWIAMGLYDRYRRALLDMREQSRRVARA